MGAPEVVFANLKRFEILVGLSIKVAFSAILVVLKITQSLFELFGVRSALCRRGENKKALPASLEWLGKHDHRESASLFPK